MNPIDFEGQRSKVKVTMVIIDKCGMRGDATLCVVIFHFVTVILPSLSMIILSFHNLQVGNEKVLEKSDIEPKTYCIISQHTQKSIKQY